MGRDWVNLTSRCIIFLLGLGMGPFEQAQFRHRKIKEATVLHIGTEVCELQTLDTGVTSWKK